MPKVATIREGNVAIPIYQYGDGRYWVVYRELGQTETTRRPRLDLGDAKRFARTTAIRLANGELPTTAAQREQILHIEKTVAPFQTSPVAAIEEWARWRRDAGVTTRKRETVPRLIQLIIASATDRKLSDSYMRELKWLKTHFTKVFPGYIDEVVAIAPAGERSLENFYRSLCVGDRRRNNIRDVIVTLFLYAKEHGYLPADKITEAEKVKRLELDHGAPQIYTPAQLRIIIEHVSPDWLDWICCQAFAGIRPEEAGKPHVSKRDGTARKLMWSDFMWDERQIRIVAQISKTGRDRYVTMNDTLIAWCGHRRGETGPVCKLNRPDRETGRLGEVLGFDWINDGLRHSYASYWMSLHKDMHTLKEEMGNSEAVNRRFYYHPQPAAIAKKWWQVLPDAHGTNKLVQLPIAFG